MLLEKIQQEHIKELLVKVCDKTISEKFQVPDIDYNFFGTEEGKGMYVLDRYQELADKFEHIDMTYELFEWQNGVGFFAIMEAGKYLDTPKYFDFVHEWLDYHLEKGLPKPSINSTVPFNCMLEVYRVTEMPKYRELCEERAQYCLAQALRADEGAFEHTVLEKRHQFTSQIWADTMFMGALFLARWGLHTNQKMYVHEALRQMNLHYKYLIDPKTGLMFHGYSCNERSHLSGVRWGRANGWALMASVYLLELIPDIFEEKKLLQEAYQKHIKAVLTYQNEDGSFHTVLDEPNTYKETTIVGAFVYSLNHALRLGFIESTEEHAQALLRGINYLTTQVAPDGQVLHASGGTPIMSSITQYNKIPCVMSYYAQGIVAMALNEIVK